MSLYALSKLLFDLNRNEAVKTAFKADPREVAAGYSLTEEERGALLTPDIGLLYVLGVNGQILMHFAALCGIEWSDYLQRMRDGVKTHGPVRAGIYALTTSPDEKVAG
ncbi:Aromatic-ring-opening dioxygenase LigAB, LigA subunit [Caulobacter sp. AP07]|uniref:aromatic ring-opening dioxygenase subunit LigA n=1 Tax=Caulobacter sp. AP07 TaxID=1144304 RepID=UPI000271E8C9|nr:aromatic ring-opening dioxygenase subunit LigA [Caulobacter sp. AP07]EJL30772.1 Aromatic-ring-opening dioxygenase LigAB, LigA subunit [Caulobacter sp. AP07]